MDQPAEPSPEVARKRELRSRARARRRDADPDARAELAPAWTEGVLGLPALRDARTVAVYESYGTEPPSEHLVDALVWRGVRVLLPVLLSDRDLDWADHAEPTVPLGRDAIAEADVVVVPALLAGLDGARLGQGGGSYDRALTRMRDGVPVVALVHDDELLPAGALPVEAHDHRVTHVVTPARAFEVGRRRAVPLPVDPDLDRPEESVRPARGTRFGDADVALAVAAGGAIGSLARWGLNEALPHSGAGFPWATFIENVSGAFVIGVLLVFLLDVWSPHRWARPFLATGILGGYTTFSTYMADVRGLVDHDHAATALLYLLATIGVGLFAAAAGLFVGRGAAKVGRS